MDLKSLAGKSIAFLAVLILLTSCGSSSSGGTSAWIDVPVDGLTLASLQPINIEGHASSPGGVSRVEVWVNGTLTSTITDLTVEGTLAGFHTTWTPTASGVFVVQAIAFGTDGSASEPDSARVTFGEMTPTAVGGCPTPIGGGPTPVSCEMPVNNCPTPVGGGPTPVSCEEPVTNCPTPVGGGPTPVSCDTPVNNCPTPIGGGPTPVNCPTLVIPAVPVVTDTPTPPPGAVIQFWADPAEIDAGACTSIRWHVENVQKVVFGGIDQPLDGSYDDCLCSDQRYTLTVTHLDGSQERPQVNIRVNGSCETPVPVDTTPPPTPSLAVPAEGLSIACKASQSLAWLPVDDPSGIARYEVQVQRQSGDGNWQDAPGGQITTTDKTTSVRVECGWYYRWRVRSVDGAGNTSGWSGWSQFSITLR